MKIDNNITMTYTHNREQIYNGMKFNIQNYGLEHLQTGYKNLDNFYQKIQIKNAGRGGRGQNQSLIQYFPTKSLKSV